MANPYFNAVYYLQQNPDVFAAGYTVATAWDHYVKHGANEANVTGGTFRAPNPWFDVKYYLANNPDLVRAGITPATALDHFLTFGSTAGEDRAPNATIAAAPITEAKLLAYALANADLQTAFGISASATTLTAAQQTSLLNHFYAYGYSENRADAPATVVIPDADPGKTFTLTNGIDQFTGSGSDDVFSGTLNAQGAVTFQAFDQLNGGAGFDTLVAQGIGTLTTNASTLQNVERVEVYAMANNATLGLGNTSGVEEILIANAVGNATVNGINAGIKSLEVVGNPTGGLNTTTFTVNNTAVVGADDSVVLKLSGVGDATTADDVNVQPTSGVNGFETIVLQSNTSPNFITLDDGTSTSLKTVKVTGDANLNLTVTPATLTAFNAAEAAGNVSVSLVTNNQDIDVKGGAGDDTFTFGGSLTKADKVDGGEGKNILAFNSTGTTLTDTFQVSNVQTLSITDALAANLDVSKFGTSVNAVRLSTDTGANTRTISKLGADATLDLRVAQTAGAQHILALANTSGTDDKVTVALNGAYNAGGATNLNYRTVKADNVENVTIQSNYSVGGNPENAGDLATLVLDAAQAKNLTITGKVGLTLAGSTLTSVTSIDSTGLAPEVAPGATAGDGGLTVTLATGANQTATVKAGNGNNVITSAAGNDNITTGNGADVVTIGAGNDTVDLGAGNDILVLGAAGDLTDKDVIKGGEGRDTIRIDATQTLADSAFTGVSGFEIITGQGAFGINLNLGANAASAFNNVIRVDQQNAAAAQPWNINAVSLTSGQKLDFRGQTASVSNDVIVGGEGNDWITGGGNVAAGGRDVMTGKGGADVFFFRTLAETKSAAAAAANTTGANLDSITDFVAGVDKIQLDQAAFANLLTTTAPTVTKGADVAAGAYADIAAIQTAFGAAAQLAASTATTVSYNIVNATGAGMAEGGAKTFLLVDLDGNAGFTLAGDMIIDITGVTGTISGADFAFGNLYA